MEKQITSLILSANLACGVRDVSTNILRPLLADLLELSPAHFRVRYLEGYIIVLEVRVTEIIKTSFLSEVRLGPAGGRIRVREEAAEG